MPRKFSARNSGGRKWLCQFHGRQAFLGSFCCKTPMPIKLLVLGGLVFFWKGGGGAEVPILFLWGVRIFLTLTSNT